MRLAKEMTALRVWDARLAQSAATAFRFTLLVVAVPCKHKLQPWCQHRSPASAKSLQMLYSARPFNRDASWFDSTAMPVGLRRHLDLPTAAVLRGLVLQPLLIARRVAQRYPVARRWVARLSALQVLHHNSRRQSQQRQRQRPLQVKNKHLHPHLHQHQHQHRHQHGQSTRLGGKSPSLPLE